MDQIVLGLTGKSRLIVTREDTAEHMGSGALPVFSTPAMAALMENAACSALAGRLPEGAATVGTALSIEHSSPTPVGMTVVATATLTEHQGNNFTFKVEAFDEKGLIGRGTHRRAAVFSARFLQKAAEKLDG